MSWNRVSLDSVPASPWRNGGGVTRELLAWPQQQDWRVRLSVAQIEADGPFSAFPGVERWFAVLAGAGVRLRIDGTAQELTTASESFQFNGGADTRCELLDGPTRDLNLMTRGQRAVMRRVSGPYSASCAAGSLVAAYAQQQATIITNGEHVDLPAGTLAWRILDSDGLIELTGEDLLWMEVEP